MSCRVALCMETVSAAPESNLYWLPIPILPLAPLPYIHGEEKKKKKKGLFCRRDQDSESPLLRYGYKERGRREAGGRGRRIKKQAQKKRGAAGGRRDGARCLIGAELALAAVVYRRGNLTPSPPILFLLRSALK